MFNHWMWGMHWGWWLFWIAVIIVVVLAVIRSQSSRPSDDDLPSSPLEILQRRYASGDLSTEEYEERKARLERDQR